MKTVFPYIGLFLFCVVVSYLVQRINEKKISNYQYVVHMCPTCNWHIADSLAKEIKNGKYDLKDTYFTLREQCSLCEKELSSEMIGNTPDTAWWKKRVVFKRKLW